MTMDLKNSLIVAEVSKIYNEIHQLRNHQFLITLAGITFFGVAVGVFFKEPPIQHSNLETIGYFRFCVVITLHAVLGILYFWLSSLSKIIAGHSVYLERRHSSDWEKYHAIYDGEKASPLSQRKLMALVFLVLGAFSAILPLVLASDERYSLAPFIPCVLWVVVSLLYLTLIAFLGFRQAKLNRDNAKNIWNIVFKKQPFSSTEY